jgi:hypothetical protein
MNVFGCVFVHLLTFLAHSAVQFCLVVSSVRLAVGGSSPLLLAMGPYSLLVDFCSAVQAFRQDGPKFTRKRPDMSTGFRLLLVIEAAANSRGNGAAGVGNSE